MKYEKEFREAHPETIGETEMAFDMGNYINWLEKEHEALKQVKNNVALADVSNQRGLLNAFAIYMVKNSNTNDGMTYKDYVEQWLSI